MDKRKQIRVLSVEDNAFDFELIKHALTDNSNRFYLMHASNKEAFDKHLLRGDFDIVLTDFNILGYEGLDVIDAVRKDNEEAPIIVLTGTGSEEIAVESLRHGANDYVIKSPKHIARLPGTILNVVEKWQAKQKIAEQSENIIRIVQDIHEGIAVINAQGLVHFTNPAAKEQFGWCEKSKIDEGMLNRIINETQFSVTSQNDEESLKTYDITVARTLWSNEYCYVITVNDISERLRNQAIIREKDDQIANIFNNLTEPCLLIKGDYTVLKANNAYSEKMRPNTDEIIGQPCYSVLFDYSEPCHKQNLVCPLIHAKQTGNACCHTRTYISDNKKHFWEIEILPMKDENGGVDLYMEIISDITDKEILRERIAFTQKMENIGRLAGGVAHDFNNQLNVILGYAELMLDRIQDKEAMDDLMEILAAGKKASDITRQLLIFSRQQAINPTVINCNGIIMKHRNLLSKLLGENIELYIDLEQDLPNILLDISRFEQILMNITINAKDAIKGHGKIVIETKKMEINEEIPIMELKPGPYVMLSISDSGCGISEDKFDKIFEPFYTTKESGKGTGLGLSAVFGIVEQAGGKIKVYSEEHIGTTFKIYLPAINAKADEIKKGQSTDLQKGNGETVLIVDDEKGIRELLKKILTKLNYNVSQAENGKHAIELIEKQHIKPDLIITDMIMPQMGGMELINYINEHFEDIKIICISGYSNNLVYDELKKTHALFLEKPFTVNDIARAIVKQLGHH